MDLTIVIDYEKQSEENYLNELLTFSDEGKHWTIKSFENFRQYDNGNEKSDEIVIQIDQFTQKLSKVLEKKKILQNTKDELQRKIIETGNEC